MSIRAILIGVPAMIIGGVIGAGIAVKNADPVITELQTLAPVIQSFALVVSSLGLIATLFLASGSAATQRKALARDAYAEYLKLVQESDPSGKPDNEKWIDYFLMMAAEQVLDAFPGDKAWRVVLVDQLNGRSGTVEHMTTDKEKYSERLKKLWSSRDTKWVSNG